MAVSMTPSLFQTEEERTFWTEEGRMFPTGTTEVITKP